MQASWIEFSIDLMQFVPKNRSETLYGASSCFLVNFLTKLSNLSFNFCKKLLKTLAFKLIYIFHNIIFNQIKSVIHSLGTDGLLQIY